MKITSLELETVCGVTSTLPVNEKPEFAFAGRSNVGKSSLINALLNRKSFARTSSQPGKTQTLNFYKVSDRIYFVDLPGYGYAKVSVEAKLKWAKMIERYLRSSQQLKTVFLLLDIRHEPNANDCQMYDWICAQGMKPIIVATKADKISRGQVKRQTDLMRKTIKAPADTTIVPFSAETKQGVEEIWAIVDGLLAAEQL